MNKNNLVENSNLYNRTHNIVFEIQVGMDLGNSFIVLGKVSKKKIASYFYL